MEAVTYHCGDVIVDPLNRRFTRQREALDLEPKVLFVILQQKSAQTPAISMSRRKKTGRSRARRRPKKSICWMPLRSRISTYGIAMATAG
jgi:hypothetical protein